MTGFMILILSISTAYGGALRITSGLEDDQVLQRDAAGVAVAAVTGESAQTGEVRARVLRNGAQVIDWRSCGQAKNGSWSATVEKIPTGGPYRIEFQLVETTTAVKDVLVGDLWLLAGQSNMVGLGQRNGAETPSVFVNMYGFGERWERAEDPLHRLDESPLPVFPGKTPSTYIGVGPGLAFGVQLHRLTGVPVGLIPCASGGTSMRQWSPALKTEAGRSLYGATLLRAQKAGGQVKGMLWYQGESDATPDDAPKYATAFVELVHAFRTDLSAPNLPFYYVQLGTTTVTSLFKEQNWNAIQELQRQVEGQITNVAMAAALDLPLFDAIHLSGEGQKRLGRRLAKLAALNLYGRTDCQPGPRPVKAVEVENPWAGVIRLDLTGGNGELLPKTHIPGFQITDATGTLLNPFYDVSLSQETPASLMMKMRRKLPEGDLFLWYGRGMYPYVNLTDAEDFALPMFGPLKVERAFNH